MPVFVAIPASFKALRLVSRLSLTLHLSLFSLFPSLRWQTGQDTASGSVCLRIPTNGTELRPRAAAGSFGCGGHNREEDEEEENGGRKLSEGDELDASISKAVCELETSHMRNGPVMIMIWDLAGRC